MATYVVREEDGTSRIILEDASGFLLLEESTSSGIVSAVGLGSAAAFGVPSVFGGADERPTAGHANSHYIHYYYGTPDRMVYA